MTRIESIQQSLEKQFPEYSFSRTKRIFKECIVAKNTKYSGADIFVNENSIKVIAGIPATKTRILLGSGVLLLKIFHPGFLKPSVHIYHY